MIRLSGVANDSIVDGTGLRFTLFTQGCPHKCKGCHNPQTHDFEAGYEASVDEIIEMIEHNPLLDGVTFSGGEPMCQAEELSSLAERCQRKGLNIWVYTGYLWERLIREDKYLKLLKFTDVLVDGPFILEKRSLDLQFKGSSNQRIIDVQKSLENGNLVLWENNILIEA